MRARPIENPRNPFSSTHLELEPDHPGAGLQVIADASREIVAKNDSPDVGFDFSVNPYRGCQHACAYCYARPTHEYLGLGAGTDFDTKIVVKHDAPELLRRTFERKSWTGELVVFSGVTDCYQPLEAKYELTKRCLEVCLEYRNPVALLTKAPLVERDVELLAELHRVAGARVMMSVPFWDREKARAIEPTVATPQRRIEALAKLARAGIPTGVMVAPIIPGLNDEDMVKVLTAARAAGATRASYVLLRLPGAVAEVFEERLRRALPNHAEKVLGRIRETRGGKLYDPRFGIRGRGQGEYAAVIERLFKSTLERLGMNREEERPPTRDTFRRPEKPRAPERQLRLL